jgi:hypothetical protein
MTPYHYGKLLNAILEMQKDVSDIKSETTKNTVTLEEHSRRSTASEKRADLQEKKLDQFIKNMEPVEDHIKFMHKLGKLIVVTLGAGASLAGIIALVRNILS